MPNQSTKPHTHDVTAVICTYNRSELLIGAIERMLAQRADGFSYEFIVVDNNSTDDTRKVVETVISQGHPHVRYLFEGKQGLSHARNAAIANARSPIIAFTDDDIRVAPDWLASIVRTFAAHPDVGFVGGKVLPEWDRKPPAWLTKEHWSPLAILDNGDRPIRLNAQNPVPMVGANLSVRANVFEEVGLFLPKFQRVKNSIGSTEDHEFQLRLFKAGITGLYAPDVVVTAAVQEERLAKAYHRRWHAGHGGFSALMGMEPVPDDALRLFNGPVYMYRRIIGTARQWIGAVLRNNSSEALKHEGEILYTLNYLRTLRQQSSAAARRPPIAEIASLVATLARRKLSAVKRTSSRHP